MQRITHISVKIIMFRTMALQIHFPRVDHFKEICKKTMSFDTRTYTKKKLVKSRFKNVSGSILLSRRERILAGGSFTLEIPHCPATHGKIDNTRPAYCLPHSDVQSILGARVLLSQMISIHNGNPSHNFHDPGLLDNLENSTQVYRIQNTSQFNHFRDAYIPVVRVFHKCTRLALLPTLYSQIFTISFFIYSMFC